MLDFSQDFITDSKLKITYKERAKHAVFLTLKLTQVGQFDTIFTWLGYTNYSKEAQRLS